MLQISVQLGLVLGVLVTLLLGPGLAVVFLTLRKRRRKARRRSPIGIDLLRSPGHSVRERLEEQSHDLVSEVFLLSSIPLTMLALFLAQAHVRGLSNLAHLIPVYVVVVLGFVACSFLRVSKTGKRLDRLRAGFDAELAVGQELDQLMRQGAVVFHDFPAENFNIDHTLGATLRDEHYAAFRRPPPTYDKTFRSSTPKTIVKTLGATLRKEHYQAFRRPPPTRDKRI